MYEVLIVEDTLTQALLIQHILKAVGYKCTLARSAAAALDILSRSPDQFDVILSDVNMPEMSGMELCTRVKSEGICRAPFVLFLSLIDTDEIINAVHSGADNFIWKHFDAGYMVPQLESIIAKHRSRRDLVVPPTADCKANGIPEAAAERWADMLVSAYGVAVFQKQLLKKDEPVEARN